MLRQRRPCPCALASGSTCAAVVARRRCRSCRGHSAAGACDQRAARCAPARAGRRQSAASASSIASAMGVRSWRKSQTASERMASLRWRRLARVARCQLLRRDHAGFEQRLLGDIDPLLVVVLGQIEIGPQRLAQIAEAVDGEAGRERSSPPGCRPPCPPTLHGTAARSRSASIAPKPCMPPRSWIAVHGRESLARRRSWHRASPERPAAPRSSPPCRRDAPAAPGSAPPRSNPRRGS